MTDTNPTRQNHSSITDLDASVAGSKAKRVFAGGIDIAKVGTLQTSKGVEAYQINKNNYDISNIFDDALVEEVKHPRDQSPDSTSLFGGSDPDIEIVSASLVPQASSPVTPSPSSSSYIHRGLFTPTSDSMSSPTPSSPVLRRQRLSHVEVPLFPKGLRARDYQPVPQKRPRSPSMAKFRPPPLKRTSIDSQLEMRDTLQAVLQNNGGLYTVSRQREHIAKYKSASPPFMPSIQSSSTSRPSHEPAKISRQNGQSVHAPGKRRELASTRYNVDKDEVQLIINGVPKDRHEVTVANTRFLDRAKNNVPIEYQGGTGFCVAVLNSDVQNIGRSWSPPSNESLDGQEDMLTTGSFIVLWKEDDNDDVESKEGMPIMMLSHQSPQPLIRKVNESSQDAREIDLAQRPTPTSRPLSTEGEPSAQRPKPRPPSHKHGEPMGPVEPSLIINHFDKEHRQPSEGVRSSLSVPTVDAQHLPTTNEKPSPSPSFQAPHVMTPRVLSHTNSRNDIIPLQSASYTRTAAMRPQHTPVANQDKMRYLTDTAHEGNMPAQPTIWPTPQGPSLETLYSLVTQALLDTSDLSKHLRADGHAPAIVADSINKLFSVYPPSPNELSAMHPSLALYPERPHSCLQLLDGQSSVLIPTDEYIVDASFMADAPEVPQVENGTIDPSLIMGNFAPENTTDVPPSPHSSPTLPPSPRNPSQSLMRYPSPDASYFDFSFSSSSRPLISQFSTTNKVSASSVQPQPASSSQPFRSSRSAPSFREFVVLDNSGDENWTFPDYKKPRQSKTTVRRSYSKKDSSYENDEAPKGSSTRMTKKKSDKGRASRDDEWLMEAMSSYCHQCRRSTFYLKLVCACSRRYCIRCLRLRYTEDLVDLSKPIFTCPCCENYCTCDVCTRKRGEVYVPLKRSHAYTIKEPPSKVKTRQPASKHLAAVDGLDGTATGEVFTLTGGHTEHVITRPLGQQILQDVGKRKRIYVGDLQESWNLGQYHTTRDLDPVSWKDRNNGPNERLYVGDKRPLYIPVNRHWKTGAQASSSYNNSSVHNDFDSPSSLSSLEDESDGGNGEGELCQGSALYAAETDFEITVQGGIDGLLQKTQENYFKDSLTSACTSRAIASACSSWGKKVDFSTYEFIYGVPKR